MCKDCGCGLPGENPTGISGGAAHPPHSHHHPHSSDHHHPHDHDHEHHHDHAHTHDHDHPHSQEPRTIDIRKAILEKNDRQAERNRGYFEARGLLVINVISSPGSGKTTLLRETMKLLGGTLKAGVIVGDLATDNDARRLREAGNPVVQVTTGTMCHLEAEMVSRAVKELNLEGLGLLIIENVGNLVCPASYDLGEDLRAVLLSVTEGEDKPLKYPPIFQTADAVIVSKIDLSEACGLDRSALLANIAKAAPRAQVFETSARSGQGMEAWKEFLLARREAKIKAG